MEVNTNPPVTGEQEKSEPTVRFSGKKSSKWTYIGLAIGAVLMLVFLALAGR